MTKIFEGRVSVVKNTKGEISLRKDENGAFSSENAQELRECLQKLSQKLHLSVNKYSLFKAPSGTESVLLVNRFGQPYLAVLPKGASAPGGRKASVTKLA